MVDVMKQQVGGNHYKQMRVQPAEIYNIFTIPGMAMMALKYVARWRQKNGVEDLKKALHSLQMQIEFDEPRWQKADEFEAQFQGEERKVVRSLLRGNYCSAYFLLKKFVETQTNDHQHENERT